MKRVIMRCGAVLAAMLAAAPNVLAQGCAMCYADAAAQGPRARQSLDFAILTLLIPSVLLFAGVLFAAFRRRERVVANAEPAEKFETRPAQTGITRSHTVPTPHALS